MDSKRDIEIINKFCNDNDDSEIDNISETSKQMLIQTARYSLNYSFLTGLEEDIEQKKKQSEISLKILKRLDPFDTTFLEKFELEFTDIQKNIIEYFYYVNSLLVSLATGCGKTITSLAIAVSYLEKNPENKVIVISPASLVKNFHKEAKKFQKTKLIDDRFTFLSFDKFLSYDKAGQCPDCTNSLLIIDEVHVLRNIKSKKFESLMRCSKKSDKILLLTATPLINTSADYLSIINLLYKDYIIAPNRTDPLLKKMEQAEKYDEYIYNNVSVEDKDKNLQYIKYYYSHDEDLIKVVDARLEIEIKDIEKVDTFFKYKISKSRDKDKRDEIDIEQLNIISKLLLNHAVHERKCISDDIFPSYKIYKENIRMEPKYTAEYMNAISAISKEFTNPKVFWNGYRRAVNKLDSDLGYKYYSTKINSIVEKIRDKKSIIYSNWLDYGTEILEEMLTDNGILNIGIINGNTTCPDRRRIVKNYNNGNLTSIIITQAAVEGIDLKNTRVVVVLDPAWSPSYIEQIKGRAVRFKSHIDLPPEERHVDIYLLALIEHDISEDDIIEKSQSGDIKLYNIIDRKQKILDESIKMLDDITVISIKN